MVDICNKCKGTKQVHYRTYCPRCEPPQVQVVRTLDLLEAFAHIQAKYYPDDESVYRSKAHDSVWSYLADCNYINNDTTTGIDFPDMLSDLSHTPGDYKTVSKEGIHFMEHLIEAFDLTSIHMKDIQWVVSW